MRNEVLAYVCSHVFAKEKPVLLVFRGNGDWQLLCGGAHMADELPRIVGLNHLMDDDPALTEILDLPAEWEAERSAPGGAWARRSSE